MSLRPFATVVFFVISLASSVLYCDAQITTFFDLSPYDGSEELIDFDSQGVRPFDEIDRISSVLFNLVNEGTGNDTGEGPTGASIPNSTNAREFAPFDGSVFVNFQFGVDLELRFDDFINTASAEIRTGPVSDVDETVTFELYDGSSLLSSETVDGRGGGAFFSYGVQSTDLFNRLIIRVRDDQRFGVDNVRFALVAIPEPASATLLTIGCCLVAARRRRR